ncbi:MAG: hypothetical protein MI924_11450, partial [Chloroflexales bacterium]|nr:hypothetical protein [Chloroflexales bacterium]
LIFFNFERFIFFTDTDPIAFAPSVYGVGVLAALLPLTPFLGRQRLSILTMLITTLFGVVLAFDPASDFGGAYTYLTCTELSFVLGALVLAYRTSRALGEFHQAVEAAAFLHTDKQLRTHHEAEERLDLAMIGSRRSQHPLNLVLLQTQHSRSQYGATTLDSGSATHHDAALYARDPRPHASATPAPHRHDHRRPYARSLADYRFGHLRRQPRP